MMTTNTLTVSAELGEELGCWAYAGTVVVQLSHGTDGIDTHLSIAQAEALVAHMQQQIAAAKAMLPKLRLVPANADTRDFGRVVFGGGYAGVSK